MTIKRIIAAVSALLLAAGVASAQASYITTTTVTSVQEGTDVFSAMPKTVSIRQSAAVKNALRAQVEKNADKLFVGFRIRVYRDNSQRSHELSQTIADKLQAAYPGVEIERTYTNPYFNVTMGAYRTRTEAEKVLQTLFAEYPEAVIIKEKFKYPTLEPVVLQAE